MFNVIYETLIDEKGQLVTIFECVECDKGATTDIFLVDGSLDTYSNRFLIIHKNYKEEIVNKRISKVLEDAKEVIVDRRIKAKFVEKKELKL